MYIEKGEMRCPSKEKTVLALVVSSLVLLLFIVLMTTKTTTNVSAVEANGVGVYWESNCINRVSSIYWGNLTPGSMKDIVVYIRNEVQNPIYLSMETANWDPTEASNSITLRWDYFGQRVNPSETLQTTLTLLVSRHIEAISSFDLDILITGSDNLPGDINGDGIVDISDVVIVALAFGSATEDDLKTPWNETEKWNPAADLDSDLKVDIVDIVMVALQFR